ncbi:MAG: hypothetical protein JWM64_2721 [Frankiales bacterium]|nr:hypothetical protein [Frankiales bacterium]
MGPLQRALSCVTDSVLVVSPGGYQLNEDGPPHGVLLNRGDAVRLPGANKPCLHVSLHYQVVRVDDADRGPFKVRTRAYRYHVLTDDGTESMLFHWHPDGKSTFARPHLHVGGALLQRDAVISRKAHVPSGRVALEMVIGMLIREYAVVPRRADHEAVLDECLTRFERWRTWSS